MKIETGIPLPPINRRRSGFSDALNQMRKGDSLRVPKHRVFGCRTMVSRANKANGRRYVTRALPGGAIRVWRTQ